MVVAFGRRLLFEDVQGNVRSEKWGFPSRNSIGAQRQRWAAITARDCLSFYHLGHDINGPWRTRIQISACQVSNRDHG